MTSFTLQHGNVYAVPVIHYNMEMAAQVRLAFQSLAPDCVAVELAETMEQELLHAASRLPDISVVVAESSSEDPLYYLCEPCDPAFEAVRSALESQIPAYCIDLDVENYPAIQEHLPDPYAVQRIGLQKYYEAYEKEALFRAPRTAHDIQRELYMARRLKELSLKHEKILFVGGMAHVRNVLLLIDKNTFPPLEHAPRKQISVCTLTERSCRDVLAECGWVSAHYELCREHDALPFPPDRLAIILRLYKEAAKEYQESTGLRFENYHLRNIIKFGRNYALLQGKLVPDLFQILTAAKSCVDSNYAHEVWALASSYPFLRNIDNLPSLDLSIEEVWGHSRLLRFQLKQKTKKGTEFQPRTKNKKPLHFFSPGLFTLCSYPPEDVSIEKFGNFLRKKGTTIATEENSRIVPFTTSLEDGVDVRETIRHWHEGRLYVRVQGKPPGPTGAVVVIFDADTPQEGKSFQEKYPWKVTWLGEHNQESDMAFYATDMLQQVIGPGISRCEYGGFLMTYPPQRLNDIWSDPDYAHLMTKQEVLLMSAIDYALDPIIVYIAASPPRSIFKNYARRFGKKLIYFPIGQLSPVQINRIRNFHVLDSHEKRQIADEYIF